MGKHLYEMIDKANIDNARFQGKVIDEVRIDDWWQKEYKGTSKAWIVEARRYWQGF